MATVTGTCIFVYFFDRCGIVEKSRRAGCWWPIMIPMYAWESRVWHAYVWMECARHLFPCVNPFDVTVSLFYFHLFLSILLTFLLVKLHFISSAHIRNSFEYWTSNILNLKTKLCVWCHLSATFLRIETFNPCPNVSTAPNSIHHMLWFVFDTCSMLTVSLCENLHFSYGCIMPINSHTLTRVHFRFRCFSSRQSVASV